jgi:transcriptional regulator with XRE-family HTH domain
VNKYGKYIRNIREKNNDTLEDLANKLDMSFSTLGKYERGERKITPELLEEVANIYDVPLSYFFGEKGELPKELKEIGAEWITFAKEMKNKKLTPDQIKATLELIEKLGKS